MDCASKMLKIILKISLLHKQNKSKFLKEHYEKYEWFSKRLIVCILICISMPLVPGLVAWKYGMPTLIPLDLLITGYFLLFLAIFSYINSIVKSNS